MVDAVGNLNGVNIYDGLRKKEEVWYFMKKLNINLLMIILKSIEKLFKKIYCLINIIINCFTFIIENVELNIFQVNGKVDLIELDLSYCLRKIKSAFWLKLEVY